MDIELFQRAFDKRKKLYQLTNAVRLVNGNGDSLPGITLDQYNRHFLIQLYDSRWYSVLDQITNFLSRGFDLEYLILKDRTSTNPRSLDSPKTVVLSNHTDPKTQVIENEITFGVDLNDGVHSGLFLDMRKNRHLVSSLSKNKSVLNCFSYTCSFGAYCRKSGASRVVNVDISRKVLQKGKENYALNHLPSEKNEFILEDCEDYLLKAIKKKNYFDIVILDPPTFSRYNNRTFSLKKEFPRLITAALQILNPTGCLFLATNCYEISISHLHNFVKKVLVNTRLKVKSALPLGQDSDFPVSGQMKESHLAALLVKFI